ncbi:MAG: glutamate-1-semialdehyde 2,1-aminomutase [Gammaproteobacteria bacterium]|nr:glutamate-1-semialdehyde 2,1-aminomutase [Gammaproteobacteria bacterium]
MTNIQNTDKELLARAKKVIPGGVNSPVRSFKSVGGTPVFIDRAEGAYLYGRDGKAYLDLICSWGAMIFGHSREEAAEILKEQALKGISFGAPTLAEIEMAEQVRSMMPSIQMLRMVNSGTEATMSAIRLARGYTDRPKLIKFNGCYHGHSDSLLAQAGSGVLSMSNPSSPGVPPEMVKHTINLEFNDQEQLKDTFAKEGKNIAAVIIEPIAGNMNLVPADQEFLQLMRELCTEHGAVLIFDEVMSGFRVALGGAQQIYGIVPDLTCLGKVIGGGLPVGGFGGKQQIMEQLAPVGPVYQAGTLSGNPMVIALGLHTLRKLDANFYSDLTKTGEIITNIVMRLANETGIKICTNQRGGMLGIYYNLDVPPKNLQEAQQQDADLFKKIFFALLNEGVHLPPSHFEACFISSAHGTEELAKLTTAIDNIIASGQLG